MPGRSLPSLIVFCALAVMTLPVHAADLSPEMRGQIEAVVKSYLLKNPEIIRDASASCGGYREPPARRGLSSSSIFVSSAVPYGSLR